MSQKPDRRVSTFGIVRTADMDPCLLSDVCTAECATITGMNMQPTIPLNLAQAYRDSIDEPDDHIGFR